MVLKFCCHFRSGYSAGVSKILTAVIFSLLFSLFGSTPVSAQQATPYELIDLTNQWRASYGNGTLITDSILMGTAQATAETMAAIKACGHLGDVRGRIQAAGFGGGSTVFATENIACGSNSDASTIVYQIWGDEIHMMPVTGVYYTHIGAGVATDNEGYSYYVLHAAYSANNPGTRPGATPASGTTVPGAVYETPAPIERYVVSVKKADPQPDGSIIHQVGYGQTLWGIADVYAVKLEDIVNLNPLIADDLMIYEGQKLLIALAPLHTATLPVTETPIPTTATPRPTLTSAPSSTPTVSVIVTLTAAPLSQPPEPEAPKSETRKIVGIIILTLCAAGLGLMIVSGFMNRKTK